MVYVTSIKSCQKDKDFISNLYLKKSICLSNTLDNFCTFEEKLKGMENKEVWKPIDGHQRYEVSSFGRVKRHEFSYLSGRWEKKFVRTEPERICKQHLQNGRAVVFVDMVDYNVDVLVARAFLDYGEGGYKTIIHKNGDPMDNRMANLSFGEHKQHETNDDWKLERDALLELYDITRDGQITRKKTGRVIAAGKDNKGYLRLRITVPWSQHPDGRKTYKLHRLVAMVYLPDYSPDLQVNHKNGVKTDNRAENLEMVTNSENAAHAWRNLDKETRSERMKTTRRTRKASRLACAVDGNDFVVYVNARTGEVTTYDPTWPND